MQYVTKEVLECMYGKLDDGCCVGLGFPYRRNLSGYYFICSSYDECVTLFEQANYTDCFITCFQMQQSYYNQNTRSTYNAVLKNITFDLDHEDKNLVREEAIRLCTWALRHNGHPIVKLTTNKGMHITIPIRPVTLANPKLILRDFVESVISIGKFQTIDAPITYDVNRIIRVPYTIHSKTNKRVNIIPLSKLFNLDTEKLYELCNECESCYTPIRTEGLDDIVDNFIEEDKKLLSAGKCDKLVYEHTHDVNAEYDPDKFVKLSNITCPSILNCITHGIPCGKRDMYLNGIYFYMKYRNVPRDEMYKLFKYIQSKSDCLPDSMIDDVMGRNKNRYYNHCYFMRDKRVCDLCPRNRNH